MRVWGRIVTTKQRLNAGRSKEPWTMHLIRCLFFIKARYGLDIRAAHIPGKENRLTDALSRNDFAYFTSQVPRCHISPQVLSAAARLDISRLDTIVQQLISAGLAPSTKNTYRAGGNRYVTWCEKLKLTAFLVTENTLTLFVASLYNDGLSGNTAKTYLAGVRCIQIAMGLDDPNMGGMPRLGYTIRGFRKLSVGNTHPHLPITPLILEKLKAVWG